MKMRRPFLTLKNTWFLWIFPLFAAMISGWLLWDYYREHGTVIKILFNDAAGLQAEKTTVRFRGVPIGKVRDVYVSRSKEDVVAEVVLRKDAANFAVEGSAFSLVTPKVTLQGISGL